MSSTSTDLRPTTTSNCNSSTESYDTDSQWIGVDSLSTYCITNDMNDFIEKPTKIRQLIKGINDTPAQVTYVGKGLYKLSDDNGKQHNFIIDRL
jgi:hypothetical protein